MSGFKSFLNVATIVTKKTEREFELFKFSLEQYHNVRWYVSCDKFIFKKFKNKKNIELFDFVKSDDCDHNLLDQGKQDRWMKVMMTKFDVCGEALKKEEYILFLDCDMLFVNPIEDNIYKLLDGSLHNGIDAFVCQHMTNNSQNEVKHGYFNAGMFGTSSNEFLNAWKNLSKDYKRLNLYFEQKPLEFVQRNFVTLNFPINYNIGWWRFNEPSTKSRMKLINFSNDGVFMFGKSKAINFHLHMLRTLETANFGGFLANVIIEMIKNSTYTPYNDLYCFYKDLK